MGRDNPAWMEPALRQCGSQQWLLYLFHIAPNQDKTHSQGTRESDQVDEPKPELCLSRNHTREASRYAQIEQAGYQQSPASISIGLVPALFISQSLNGADTVEAIRGIRPRIKGNANTRIILAGTKKGWLNIFLLRKLWGTFLYRSMVTGCFS